MSRLSILDNHQLPENLRKDVEEADRKNAGSTVLRVMGHRPEMVESYFNFYFPLHNGGVVETSVKELVRLRIAELNQCFT